MVAEDAGKDVVRESFDFKIIRIHGSVEVSSRYIDAIFGTLDIGLEILEGFGGLQIRVGFCSRHQPAEGTLQLPLGLLVAGQGGGVIDIDGHAGSFGPRSDHIFQSGFLEISRSLDRLHHAIIQIRTTLVVGLYITPGIFDALVYLYQPIVTITTTTAQQ